MIEFGLKKMIVNYQKLKKKSILKKPNIHKNWWFGAMSGLGLSSLHIVEHGKMVDGEYYRDIILNEFFYELDSRKRKTKNITTTKMVRDLKDYWFQQDSAPTCCKRNFGDVRWWMSSCYLKRIVAWYDVFQILCFFCQNNSPIKNTKLHFF